MKVLVIGGLGYIGSDLCPKLDRFAEITILDVDLFNSSYVPDSNITLIKTNMIHYNEGFEQFDKIIIMSDIDCESFYQFAHYRGYLQNYQAKLLEICKSNTEIYYVCGYLESNELQKDFVEENIEKMLEVGNSKIHILKTPDIYGDNINIRSDKLINSILRGFILDECFVLHINASEIITFAHIFQYVDDLLEYVLNDKSMPNYDRLPAMLLANIVHWSLDNGSKYAISIGALSATSEIIESTNIRYAEAHSLKHNVNMMMTAIQNGLSDALLKPSSDHEHVLAAAMVGYDVTSRLLSP